MTNQPARDEMLDFAIAAFREVPNPVVSEYANKLADAFAAEVRAAVLAEQPAVSAVAPATAQATLQYAFRVSEIRDNVLRRVHGYYASLEGAFAYCETEERKQPLIDTVRFELFPAPGGTQWMIHSFYGPNDHCPEISDLVITRIPVIPDETPREAADNETQDQAHEAHHRWIVEIRDGSEWIPATGFVADRGHAAAQFLKASEQHPTFSDGTPVQRRFVRETTTYTVEPTPNQPADGAQPKGTRP